MIVFTCRTFYRMFAVPTYRYKSNRLKFLFCFSLSLIFCDLRKSNKKKWFRFGHCVWARDEWCLRIINYSECSMVSDEWNFRRNQCLRTNEYKVKFTFKCFTSASIERSVNCSLTKWRALVDEVRFWKETLCTFYCISSTNLLKRLNYVVIFAKLNSKQSSVTSPICTFVSCVFFFFVFFCMCSFSGAFLKQPMATLSRFHLRLTVHNLWLCVALVDDAVKSHFVHVIILIIFVNYSSNREQWAASCLSVICRRWLTFETVSLGSDFSLLLLLEWDVHTIRVYRLPRVNKSLMFSKYFFLFFVIFSFVAYTPMFLSRSIRFAFDEYN